MEKILHIYELPYDKQYPVVCFDEKPCALYADVTPPIAAEPAQFDEEGKIKRRGRPKKVDSEYIRHGACSVLIAIEPLTGTRKVVVSKNRKATTFAQFFKDLAALYPDAIKISVILDNLNTHEIASFYKLLPAQEAFAISERFTFFYTPVKGSWLNMAEIELSALTRICLDQRFESIEIMNTHIQQLIKERMDNQVIIKWQFTHQKARIKLKRHYCKVNPLNEGIDVNVESESKLL
jgi:hypothetical protein